MVIVMCAVAKCNAGTIKEKVDGYFVTKEQNKVKNATFTVHHTREKQSDTYRKVYKYANVNGMQDPDAGSHWYVKSFQHADALTGMLCLGLTLSRWPTGFQHAISEDEFLEGGLHEYGLATNAEHMQHGLTYLTGIPAKLKVSKLAEARYDNDGTFSEDQACKFFLA